MTQFSSQAGLAVLDFTCHAAQAARSRQALLVGFVGLVCGLAMVRLQDCKRVLEAEQEGVEGVGRGDEEILHDGSLKNFFVAAQYTGHGDIRIVLFSYAEYSFMIYLTCCHNRLPIL